MRFQTGLQRAVASRETSDWLHRRACRAHREGHFDRLCRLRGEMWVRPSLQGGE